MKILALDSSGLVASVAVVSDDNLIGEYTINYKSCNNHYYYPYYCPYHIKFSYLKHLINLNHIIYNQTIKSYKA